MPSPAKEAEPCKTYEDSLTGGQVFAMYCSYCHNAPSLAENPYAQFRNIAAHMRVRANLTGKEYAKLMEFLRRWNDVPPPTAPVESVAQTVLLLAADPRAARADGGAQSWSRSSTCGPERGSQLTGDTVLAKTRRNNESLYTASVTARSPAHRAKRRPRRNPADVCCRVRD